MAAVALAATVATAHAAELSAGATGVVSALGPAGVAVSDWAPGGGANPALLCDADRAAAALALELAAGARTPQRLGIALPAAARAGLALDVTRAEVATALGVSRRDEWRLGAGRRFASALALGADLRLRREAIAGRDATSDGLDLGVHLRPAGAVQFGAVVRNAVRPRLQRADETWREPRLLHAAVAVTHARTTAAVGVATSTSARGALWAGVRWRGGRGFELDLGASHRAQSAGCGVPVGAARLEVVARRGDGTAFGTALRWQFGASRAARRAAADRHADDAFSARLGREIEAGHARRVEAWRRDAGEAAARGEHARAAELYRNVLLWQDDDEAARDGLRRAQRAALLARADSLTAAGDHANAAGALAGVLRQSPDDSVATARLRDARRALRRVDRGRSESMEQMRRGLDAYAAQQYAAAARAFEAARALDPENDAAREFLAHARATLEHHVEAALTQARQRLEGRDFDAARASVETALAAAPNHKVALALRDEVERESERQAADRRRPVRLAEESREDRAPVPPAVLSSGYQQGMQLYRAGDLVAAMRAWEDLARLAPHYEDVDQYLLRVYRVCGLERYTEGRLREAIDIWEKALRLEPDNSQVRRYLNQANAKMKRAHEPRGSR
jgi:tetratricopeptide (TPR) repeat protein